MGQTDDKAELERRLAEERSERANAAAATAEPGDDEPADEPEDEPGDEPEDEPADEPAGEGPSMELQAEQLGELMDGFEAGLRELFGIAEPLPPVPMEGMFGFMLPGTLDYRTNDKFRRCSTCNGQGEVLTGSIADGKQTANCPRCDGRGYLEKLDEHEQQPAASETAANGAVDPDAGYGVPKWMGNPDVRPS
jgi:hypothetical protein